MEYKYSPQLKKQTIAAIAILSFFVIALALVFFLTLPSQREVESDELPKPADYEQLMNLQDSFPHDALGFDFCQRFVIIPESPSSIYGESEQPATPPRGYSTLVIPFCAISTKLTPADYQIDANAPVPNFGEYERGQGLKITSDKTTLSIPPYEANGTAPTLAHAKIEQINVYVEINEDAKTGIHMLGISIVDQETGGAQVKSYFVEVE
nr:hypothetical protein Josef01_05d18_33 [uncultured archaeon]